MPEDELTLIQARIYSTDHKYLQDRAGTNMNAFIREVVHEAIKNEKRGK